MGSGSRVQKTIENQKTIEKPSAVPGVIALKLQERVRRKRHLLSAEGPLLDHPRKPSRGGPLELRIAGLRVQDDEAERVVQREPRHLPRGEFREEDVALVECALEANARVGPGPAP